MAERQRQGWSHGAEHDDAHKLDPALVPWESLLETDKEKSRAPVRDIPLLIRKAGFQIRMIG